MNQLPTGQTLESNPFSLSVPSSIRTVSPDLYEFLRVLTTNLREQQDRNQAGDTSFDWQMILALHSEPEYALGSLGRFSHPDYGLLRARYVRFAVTEGMGQPVSRVAGSQGLSWAVASKLNDSWLGLVAAYETPEVGEYGWVLTEGTNLTTIRADARPQPGGTVTVGGKPVGQFAGGLVVEETVKFLIPPATVRLSLESAGGGAGAGGSALLDPLGFGTQIREIREYLEREGANGDLALEILSRRVTQLTDDRASVEYTERLQAMANFKNLSELAALQAGRFSNTASINAIATNQMVRDAKVYRDEAGLYAASATEFSNSAGLGAAQASVSAGQAAESSLTAAGYSAQALEYVTLAASVGDNLVKNATFADPRWEATQHIPPLWGEWEIGTQYIGRIRPGYYGPNALNMMCPAGAPNVGVVQVINIDIAGTLLWGADLEYITGLFGTSIGMYIQWFTQANGEGSLIGSEAYRFYSENTVEGTLNIPAEVRKMYSWSKPITIPSNAKSLKLFLMARWSGFNGDQNPPALNITWHNVYLKKPVYSADSGAQAYTDARIAEVNQAIADETEARTEQYNTAQSRFQSIEGDISNLVLDTNRLSGDVNNIVSTQANHESRITTVSNNLGSEVQARESLGASYSQYVATNDGRFQPIYNALSSYDSRITANADNLGAEVTARQQLSTTVNGHTATLESYQTAFNGLQAKWGVRTNVNGRITGIELNSGAQSSDFIMVVDRFKMETPFGNVTPFEVTPNQFRLGVNLYMGSYLIISDTGTVMNVIGVGFGTNGQFVEWFGPTMNPSQCTEAAAISYKRTDGFAYHGGGLNAGVLSNAAQTSLVANVAGIRIGPFGSNGRQRVITCTWTRTGRQSNFSSGPVHNGNQIRGTLRLYRGADATGTFLTSQQFIGNVTVVPAQGGDPGSYSWTVNGSFTFNDNTGGTGDQNFYAEVTLESQPGFTGTGGNAPVFTQRVGIISVEQ